MNTSKDYLHKLIDEIGADKVPEIIDFVEFLKIKKEKLSFQDFSNASLSSTDFWDNDVDDKIWNNV